MKRSMQLGLAALVLAFLSSVTILEMAPGSSRLILVFTVAFAYLFFPEAIQSFCLRAVRIGATTRGESLVAFVGSTQYLSVVRAMGFCAGSAGVYLLIESFAR